MKRQESFEELRKRKVKFSLRTRLTLSIGAVVLCSIVVALGLSSLLTYLIPQAATIPTIIQLNVFSLLVALIVARWLSQLFFKPITHLREGMQRVADGDLSVQLETRSSSTEIREMIAGFNMMTRELQATEILQSDFVSGVSHEFKTPINAIEGYSTLLQGGENLDADQREYVDKILFNTKRLSTLISHILLLSKIENQTIQPRREPYGLDEQVRECIVALETVWGAKEIEPDVELEDVEYYGNEPMMYHVWSNLIGNAVKFSPSGSTVRVRLRQADGHIVFTVEDEGPGLTEDVQKHMFDKFYQGDTSHKQEGNGLGLPLVKRIVTLAGGTITGENLADGGCRFTVVL